LIHDHGIWLPTNHATAVIAFQLGIPMIVSPRGMLEPWSLRYKNWKKRLAWYLYQHGDLLTAQLFHITALQEAKSLRDLGFRQPIALIPNGVEVPNWCSRPKPQTELRTALFLSRIHPVKGLLELIKAWATVRPSHWQVVIAGPDECGHQKSVEKAVNEAGLQGVFSFIGEVEGEAKTKLYCQADLFILPTFSESFGVVVAEALACGVPVITTKGAPWKELITHRCGWWVDIGVEPLADAIRAATMLSDTERYAMGKRGRQFVECNFGWSHIAEQMISVYRWMVGQGGKPECVITD
jgi:glycosyltransferase involved in cell wall biosynthesis